MWRSRTDGQPTLVSFVLFCTLNTKQQKPSLQKCLGLLSVSAGGHTFPVECKQEKRDSDSYSLSTKTEQNNVEQKKKIG